MKRRMLQHDATGCYHVVPLISALQCLPNNREISCVASTNLVANEGFVMQIAVENLVEIKWRSVKCFSKAEQLFLISFLLCGIRLL
jgi:hypothetical protein